MFQSTGYVIPVNQNLLGVTNDETRHSHLRSVHSRRRRRCRCYYTQDRSRASQPSVGIRECADAGMQPHHAMRYRACGQVETKSNQRDAKSNYMTITE